MTRLRAAKRELTVGELADVFGTSALTIRRDLDALARQGAILRTLGGCVIRTGLQSGFQERIASNFELKRAIGAAAAETVRTGEVILIDDGSTTFHLATNLGKHAPLAVYTNSIAIIPEIIRFPSIRLHVLGGEYDPSSNFLGGGTTERILEMLEFDAVYVGCEAIDERGRCLVNDPGVARLAQMMIRRGGRKVLLADHTKVGARGHALMAALSDFDMWITCGGLAHSKMSFYGKMTEVREAEIPAGIGRETAGR